MGTNLIQNLFWSPELVIVAEKMKVIDILKGKKTLPFFSYSSKFGNFLSTHKIFCFLNREMNDHFAYIEGKSLILEEEKE